MARSVPEILAAQHWARALWPRSLPRPRLGFCVGTKLPLRSHSPDASAFGARASLAPWTDQARCCSDIALLWVTIKRKYVNSTDLMADISLTAPNKSRSVAVSA